MRLERCARWRCYFDRIFGALTSEGVGKPSCSRRASGGGGFHRSIINYAREAVPETKKCFCRSSRRSIKFRGLTDKRRGVYGEGVYQSVMVAVIIYKLNELIMNKCYRYRFGYCCTIAAIHSGLTMPGLEQVPMRKSVVIFFVQKSIVSGGTCHVLGSPFFGMRTGVPEFSPRPESEIVGTLSWQQKRLSLPPFPATVQ